MDTTDDAYIENIFMNENVSMLQEKCCRHGQV